MNPNFGLPKGNCSINNGLKYGQAQRFTPPAGSAAIQMQSIRLGMNEDLSAGECSRQRCIVGVSQLIVIANRVRCLVNNLDPKLVGSTAAVDLPLNRGEDKGVVTFAVDRP